MSKHFPSCGSTGTALNVPCRIPKINILIELWQLENKILKINLINNTKLINI